MSDQKNCFHCGEVIEHKVIFSNKSFCCTGCKSVYEIIHANGLDQFYQLNEKEFPAGTKIKETYLDSLKEPSVAANLLDYKNLDYAIVSFILPDIHCASCVWLLERLNQLNPNIIASQINFLQKRVKIRFNYHQLSLFNLADLLQKIGYSPQFIHEGVEKKDKSLLIKIGVAGFAFGNIMLLSFPDYVSEFTDEYLKYFFSYLSIGLSLPVIFYSANIFYKNVYWAFKQRKISIDIPIVLGIISLFTRSLYDILILNEASYLDSLTGLIFFLLLGKWFQSKVFNEFSFERSAKDYLPLAVLKKTKKDYEITALANINVGDVIQIRNQEIVPFEAELLNENALIDQSFINGEALPEQKIKGDKIYCGAKLVGKAIELKVLTNNTSNLFNLWQDQEAKTEVSDKLIQYFTYTIILLGILAFSYHLWINNLHDAFIAASSVWIIACPCALALVQPTIWGSVIRKLSSTGIYLKSVFVIQKLQNIKHIIFDKTGTLTGKDYAIKEKTSQNIPDEFYSYLYTIAQQSAHPLAKIILQKLLPFQNKQNYLEHIEENADGISAQCKIGEIKIGKKSFIQPEDLSTSNGQQLELWYALNNVTLGTFFITLEDRGNLAEIFTQLKPHFNTYLLSGDPNLPVEKYTQWLPVNHIFKNFNPEQKFQKVNSINELNDTLMIGDGINDSLAFQAASVGLAVVEQNGAFFPKCDGILMGDKLYLLPKLLLSIDKIPLLRGLCFLFSFAYNSVGIYFAFTLQLSPLFASILMPLSSVTIVAIGIFGVKYLFK